MELNCPLPLHYQHIVMAHGGGGRLMQQLLENIIQPTFSNDYLNQHHDSAVFESNGQRLAFTSDSYVIKPLFFKGGDIGKLAVCGTINDLAMTGAKPLFLSCSLIIEEGLPIETLQTILQSMQKTAAEVGAFIVTGDTKVVDKGKGDGLYINTAGIGIIDTDLTIRPSSIQVGDAVIVSGDLARHGIAVMLEREGLDFDSDIQSDCAALSPLVQDLLNANINIHCLRDLTRGGLASCLNELAKTANVQINIQETQLPINSAVKTACELLGFDPLYVANEGCFALFLPQHQVETALNILKKHAVGQHATQIGKVEKSHEQGLLTLTTPMGIVRVLDLLSGEQLPRIC
ncbi:Carbamoyl dehydratase HypE [Candidatus Brocadiaceae bacterium]|nr:Carbamoyl dehydratase HypE [Candidatus Brocadiaceae bacterium]